MQILDTIIMRYIPKNQRCRFEEQKNEMNRQKEKAEILGNNPASVSVRAEWERRDPDMSVCRACKEVIYGTGFKLRIYVNNEQVQQTRPVILCEPCYIKSK